MKKEAGPGLVGPLVSLFNASLRLRKVPDEWRKSTIKPIFKVAGRTDGTLRATGPSHLHPVLQELWRKSLMPGSLSTFKKNSLLYEHQSGFQRNHSISPQLCFLAHQWTTALDGGKNVQSVFLDLSKAYDRVSIPGLLSKLSLIGFSSSATGMVRQLPHAQRTMCSFGRHNICTTDPKVRDTTGHGPWTSALPDFY